MPTIASRQSREGEGPQTAWPNRRRMEPRRAAAKALAHELLTCVFNDLGQERRERIQIRECGGFDILDWNSVVVEFDG